MGWEREEVRVSREKCVGGGLQGCDGPHSDREEAGREGRGRDVKGSHVWALPWYVGRAEE